MRLSRATRLALPAKVRYEPDSAPRELAHVDRVACPVGDRGDYRIVRRNTAKSAVPISGRDRVGDVVFHPAAGVADRHHGRI